MRLFCLTFIVFLSHCVLCTLSKYEYIVALYAPDDKTTNRRDFLKSHITAMEWIFSAHSIEHIYWNLAELDFLAYSIELQNEEQIELIRNVPAVKFVEKVGYMNVASRPGPSLRNTVAFDPQYIRPETPNLSKDGFCNMGYHVYNEFVQETIEYDVELDIFVLDTGIQSTHETFGGRVEHGVDIVNPARPLRTDPHGHGTQIAGIIGGKDYGVAKNVHLVDVRVMDADGTGRVNDIIAGLDYVIGRHLTTVESRGPLTSLACMSMAGELSKTMRYALYFISKAVLVVTSLGETDSFSCTHSPMDSPYILTVGALERDSERELPGSNFGDCVDMYAPGEEIPAPWIGESNMEQRNVTGSSASSAVVAGIAADLIATIRSNTFIYPRHGRTVYVEMIQQVEAGFHVMFIRNILLGSRKEVKARGMANHKTVEQHPWKSIECDIHERFDLKNSVIGQLELLEQRSNRPKAFQKVKNNLADHTRRKAEDYYAK